MHGGLPRLLIIGLRLADRSGMSILNSGALDKLQGAGTTAPSQARSQDGAATPMAGRSGFKALESELRSAQCHLMAR